MDEKGTQPSGSGDHINKIMQSEVESRQTIAQLDKDRHNKLQRSLVPILVVLTPVAIAMTVWNLVGTSAPERIFSVEREVAGAEFTIYVTATELELFRDSMGFYPPDLEQISMDDDGVSYQENSGSYTISVALETETVTYESGEDLTPFEESFDRATEGTPQ